MIYLQQRRIIQIIRGGVRFIGRRWLVWIIAIIFIPVLLIVAIIILLLLLLLVIVIMVLVLLRRRYQRWPACTCTVFGLYLGLAAPDRSGCCCCCWCWCCGRCWCR